MPNTAVFQVHEYMIVLRQLEEMDFHGSTVRLRGIVRCIGDEFTLDVYGCTSDSDFPQPHFDSDEKKGHMFVPFESIPVFIDMLRNEKPIYAHLRGDKPEWTSITTTKEPVGEGEDAMLGSARS